MPLPPSSRLIPIGPRPRSCRAGGMVLVEMLFAIGLLSLFSLAATRLYYGSFKTARAAHEAASAVQRLDAALWVLRADVWGASDIRVAGPSSVTLVQPGGRSVTWEAGDGALTRGGAPAGPARHWGALGARVAFSRDGAALAVGIAGTPDRSGGETRLVSQFLLAGGQTRE